jgi:uncharacterized membrane protein (UPF0127 family)
LILGSLFKLSDDTCLIENAWKTETSWERMRGLLGRDRLTSQEALMLSPCASIHTVGMGYPIDVAYLSKDGTVLKTVSKISPFRFSVCSGAHVTVEMSAGFLERHPLQKGERLVWRKQP